MNLSAKRSEREDPWAGPQQLFSTRLRSKGGMRTRLFIVCVAAAFVVSGPVPASLGQGQSDEVILYSRSFPAADGSALCVTDPAGTRTAILKSFMGAEVDQPVWSPDGQRIAFQRDGDIVVTDAFGDNAIVIAHGEHPSWAPDGSRLAFEYGGEVWTADVDGSDQEVLATGRNPDWSPLGDRIAFDQVLDPPEHDAPEGELRTMDTQGGDVRDLGYGHDATWSPDGSEILFALKQFYETYIRVVDAGGTAQRDLHHTNDFSRPGFPTWSPDGTRVLFTWESALWVVNSDGTNLHRIVRDGGLADWGPAGVNRAELWLGRPCTDPRRFVSLTLHGHLFAKGRVRTNDPKFCEVEGVSVGVYRKTNRGMRLAGNTRTDAGGRFSMELRVHQMDGSRLPDRPGRYRAFAAASYDASECEPDKTPWKSHAH
jgi:dipeptidyl aminopeptidase/acylaminoacyl peptidase